MASTSLCNDQSKHSHISDTRVVLIARWATSWHLLTNLATSDHAAKRGSAFGGPCFAQQIEGTGASLTQGLNSVK